MEKDLHNNIDDRVALVEQAIAADTLVDGEIIDTQGFESLEYVVQVGTITTGVVGFIIQEGDDSGLSDAANVPAAETLGSLTGFIVTDDDATKRVGSIGKKRYQRFSILPDDSAAIDFISAVAILGHPHTAPVAQ